MSRPLQLYFVQSASEVHQLPSASAEVAIVGRSNVGKSSLINALANRKKLAKVSNTPGRTRLLNLFQLEKSDGTVMDLPGYGYASVGRQMSQSWRTMIETYLLERENLTKVIVLVDGLVGPTKLDIQMLDWLHHNELPYEVVATKHDKVKASTLVKRKKELAAKCGLKTSEVLWVSARKGLNLAELRSRIARWLA